MTAHQPSAGPQVSGTRTDSSRGGSESRSAASAVAARLAPLADLQPGTARSYIYAELARLEGQTA